MDPRDVLELIGAAQSASGVLGDRASASEADPDVDAPSGLVHTTRLPARRAELVDVPDDVPAVVRSRLARAGIERLYRHQGEAHEAARRGEHVVVATGTASGKSLAYWLPILTATVEDSHASTIYLAPTKALGRDQLRALRSFTLPQVRAAVLDGDTPRAEREAIRRTANVVLTNPDLLHHSLLPDHKRWGDLLHRLRFVVVDEAHVARGVFGGHVALVLRRLQRLCERYGSSPQFLLASATIGNPGEHAGRLVGTDVTEVVRDGSPRGAMSLGLWQPPMVDVEEGRRRSLISETGDLLASFVGSEVQTLVFAKSRAAAEYISLAARDRLGPQDPLHRTIKAYRAGYLAEERRQLEEQLRDGRLKGLAATEALELGIDVAGLDAVLLAGWPGTAASFWQRLGRAGRSGDSSVGVLVAADDPLDQYLVTHPRELIEREPEDAFCDPANPHLLGPHLLCAAHEAAIDHDEAARWFGPTAPDLLDDHVASGRLRRRGELHHWAGRKRPSDELSMRSMGGEPVRIVLADEGTVIGDVDAGRARRQVHPGAVYVHQGRRYEVADLDLERGIALVDRDTTGKGTRARSDTDVRLVEVLERAERGQIGVGLGRVEVTVTVTGYDVLAPGSREVVDRVELDLPPEHLHTVAVFWTIPEPILLGAELAPKDWPGSLHAAEHAAIGMLPLIALCDRWDIGGLSTALHPDTGVPTVFIYDGYAGGAGLAERSYQRLEEHLRATRETVSACPCATGCPSCVQSPKCGNGNEPLDKAGAVTVLDLVLRG